MSNETLAARAAKVAGARFTEQTCENLILALGEQKVHQMVLAAQSANDGTAALGRLQNCLFCVADRVVEKLKSLAIEADARAVLRAARFDAGVIPALRRILADKAVDGDVATVQQAFAQSASAREPAAAVQSTGHARPHSPGRQAPPQDPARQQTPARANGEPAADDTPRRGKSKHVYGGKAALCFEVSRTRDQRLAMNVDGANATGVRQYDWRNKTVIQLSEDEMFGVMGVLLGPAVQIEYSGHGPQHDKAFSIQRQNPNFFVKVTRKGATAAVPMTPMDARALMLMMAEAMVAEHPVLRDLEGIRSFLYCRDDQQPQQRAA